MIKKFTIFLITFILSILTWATNPRTVAAQVCAPISIWSEDQTCAPNLIQCDYKVPIGRGGTLTPMCCESDLACEEQREEYSSNVTRPIVNVCSYAGDSEGDCNSCLDKEGIWTALGCISYEQDQFTLDIVKIIMGVAGTASFIMMLIGSVLYMTGGSNPEQVKRGKELFTGAVVGLLFLIFSVVILQIITKDVIKIDL